jgi:uncharacterized protein (TIGR00369 family)
MTNAGDNTPYGAGSHGHEFPEIDSAVRQTIVERFNADSRFFPGTLGCRVVDIRRGYARLTVENRMALMQPVGVMHGGASFGLADTAVAAALASLYPEDTLLLTIEMKINYLEPIFEGMVTAEAYVLRSSRRSAYAEADIWAGGKLAARASTTYMVKPRSTQ